MIIRYKLIKCAVIVLALAAACGASAVEPATYSLVGMDYVRIADPNLTGYGVSVAVVERSQSYDGFVPLYDYKPEITHPALANSQINFPADYSQNLFEPSSHSTAICSILAGSFEQQNENDFQYIAPLKDSEISLYEFWDFLAVYLYDKQPLETDVLTLSFGTPAPNWWTRGMGQLVANNSVVAVASIGNGGEIFGDSLYPAAGGNFIAVGLADRQMMPDTDSIWLDDVAQSSSGYTEKGLIKPDIVAPGNFLVADQTNGGYISSGSYSSFAAPAVAAVAGVLVGQAKENGFTAAYDDKGSHNVIRAVLMSSAAKGAGWHKGSWNPETDYKYPLDFKQGSGILDAKAAYKLMQAGQAEPGSQAKAGWDNNTVSTDIEHTYRLVPDENHAYISATLCWNKAYSDEFPFDYLPQEDVNLRLELWLTDKNDPNERHLIDYSDSETQNVEHLFTPIGDFDGFYDLVVVFSDAEDAGREVSQRYGLAFTSMPMPKHWQGNWLDFDGDGKLTTNDIQAAAKFEAAEDGKISKSISNVYRMNGIRILLNELAKKGELR